MGQRDLRQPRRDTRHIHLDVDDRNRVRPTGSKFHAGCCVADCYSAPGRTSPLCRWTWRFGFVWLAQEAEECRCSRSRLIENTCSEFGEPPRGGFLFVEQRGGCAGFANQRVFRRPDAPASARPASAYRQRGFGDGWDRTASGNRRRRSLPNVRSRKNQAFGLWS